MELKNYLLLEVVQRDITSENFPTLAQAQAKMLLHLEEILQFSPLDTAQAIQAGEPRGINWDFDGTSAWCNLRDEDFDWKIIEHRTSVDTNEVQYDGSILLRWTIEDVLDLEPSLTEEEAVSVLQAALDAHDANFGITWSCLQAAIDACKMEGIDHE